MLNYVTLSLGVLVFLANFLIFSILLTKKNKHSTEVLILFNLLNDGLSGLSLIIGAIIDISNIFSVFKTELGYDLFLLSFKFLSSFLNRSSVLLMIMMTVNRYFAVLRPFSYKRVFRKANIVLYACTVFTISALTSCIDPISWVFELPYRQITIDVVYCYQVLSILITAGLMIYVYVAVHREFEGQNFWKPILGAFRLLFCYSICCKWFKCDVRKLTSQSSIDNNSENSPLVNSQFRLNAEQEDVNENEDEITASVKKVIEKKQRRMEHSVTTTFLFIVIVYLIVSLPVVVCLLLLVTKPSVMESEQFWAAFNSTAMLYGISFLINPYLFAFQNAYVREKLSMVARRCYN